MAGHDEIEQESGGTGGFAGASCEVSGRVMRDGDDGIGRA